MTSRAVRFAAALAAMSLAVSACGRTDDPASMSCGDWLAIASDQRIALTAQIVGTSDTVLGRIRAAAAKGTGVDVGTREALVAWVEGSLTKNCDVWPPRTRSVRATFEALYP